MCDMTSAIFPMGVIFKYLNLCSIEIPQSKQFRICMMFIIHNKKYTPTIELSIRCMPLGLINCNIVWLLFLFIFCPQSPSGGGISKFTISTLCCMFCLSTCSDSFKYCDDFCVVAFLSIITSHIAFCWHYDTCRQ